MLKWNIVLSISVNSSERCCVFITANSSRYSIERCQLSLSLWAATHLQFWLSVPPPPFLWNKTELREAKDSEFHRPLLLSILLLTFLVFVCAAKDNHVTLLWSTRRVVVAEAAFRATTAATAIAAAAAAVAACGSCWTAAAAAASLKKKTA